MRVCIHGDPATAEIQQLEAKLRERWKALSLPPDKLELDHWAPGQSPGGASAADVHVRFGSDPSDGQALRDAADGGCPVFAVVANAPAAGGLPEPLCRLNAFLQDRYGRSWCAALVDEIFTRVVLPRRVPQVFISYRRVDSEAVAKQLHAEFTRLGFLVFLDTVSVPVAEDFQRELMWRLNDTDLVLLLASPRLDGSDWVRQEVEFAKSAGVGMMIVRWPDPCFSNNSSGKPRLPNIGAVVDSGAVYPLQLADLQLDPTLPDERSQAPFAGEDPAEHSLTPGAIGGVVEKALDLRARALHERRLDLLGYVYRREHKAGHDPQYGSVPGDLRVRRGDEEHLIRVFPFRPEPVMLHGTAQAVAVAGEEAQSASAIYRENYPYDARVQAVQWLAEREGFSVEPFSGSTTTNKGGQT